MKADGPDEVLDALAGSLRAQLARLRSTSSTALDRNELLERWVLRPGVDELPGEERWVHSAVTHLLIALDPPEDRELEAVAPHGALYRLELLCEVSSRAEVDRLLDAMKDAACPYGDDEDHECPVPWMTMASRIDDDDEEAEGIREMLNRR